jgi:hypothetical protein
MIRQISLVLFTAFFVVAPARSATIYLGTFPGNDWESAVEAAIASATGTAVNITLYDKSDGGPLLTSFTPSLSGDLFNGTWDVFDNAVGISFLTVKASNSFALYQYNAPVNSGGWSTEEILNGGGRQPALSHLTLWTSEVPEPGTFALLGLALIAGVVLHRRLR